MLTQHEDIKRFNSLVAFGCHNDDIELRAGGTVLKSTKAGARGMYVLLDHIGSTEAATLLQCDCHSLGYAGFYDPQSMHALFTCENMKNMQADIKQIILERNADFILTHCIDDHHPDHYMMSRCVYLAVMDLIKEDKFAGELWFWEFGGAYGNSLFKPDVGIDITEFMARKVRALEYHKAQLKHAPVLRQSIYSRSRRWGAYFGYEFAEAFIKVTPQDILLREQAHLDETEWTDASIFEKRFGVELVK